MQDSRSAARYAFGVEQRVATMVAGEMPTLDDFQPVRCADISRSGFAFFQTARPDFSSVMLALGLPPEITYLMGRVIHARLIEMCGMLVFRVGCRFTAHAVWDEEAHTFVTRDDLDSVLPRQGEPQLDQPLS
jgi:hypothetical protein